MVNSSGEVDHLDDPMTQRNGRHNGTEEIGFSLRDLLGLPLHTQDRERQRRETRIQDLLPDERE